MKMIIKRINNGYEIYLRERVSFGRSYSYENGYISFIVSKEELISMEISLFLAAYIWVIIMDD